MFFWRVGTSRHQHYSYNSRVIHKVRAIYWPLLVHVLERMCWLRGCEVVNKRYQVRAVDLAEARSSRAMNTHQRGAQG